MILMPDNCKAFNRETHAKRVSLLNFDFILPHQYVLLL